MGRTNRRTRLSKDEQGRLSRIRSELEAVRADPAATARVLVAPKEAADSVAILPGAFNPPTCAHLALVRAATEAGFEAVYFALGSVTLDKDEAGLVLEDRLLLLEELARESPERGLLLHNQGLYADQVRGLRALFPDVGDLAFLCGTDKIVQLFDPSYYDDMEASLEALFEGARLLVAARDDVPSAERKAAEAHPLRARFADRIAPLTLDSEWRSHASTRVREAILRGEDVSDLVPEAVASLLARTGAFGVDDPAYGKRVAAIRALGRR